jgi:hypothetical protein
MKGRRLRGRLGCRLGIQCSLGDWGSFSGAYAIYFGAEVLDVAILSIRQFLVSTLEMVLACSLVSVKYFVV